LHPSPLVGLALCQAGTDAVDDVYSRQQVLNALELYASRLYSLETLYASRSREEKKPLQVPA
jgi:hypothetical protein